jgi:hypothetical protein
MSSPSPTSPLIPPTPNDMQLLLYHLSPTTPSQLFGSSPIPTNVNMVAATGHGHTHMQPYVNGNGTPTSMNSAAAVHMAMSRNRYPSIHRARPVPLDWKNSNINGTPTTTTNDGHDHLNHIHHQHHHHQHGNGNGCTCCSPASPATHMTVMANPLQPQHGHGYMNAHDTHPPHMVTQQSYVNHGHDHMHGLGNSNSNNGHIYGSHASGGGISTPAPSIPSPPAIASNSVYDYNNANKYHLMQPQPQQYGQLQPQLQGMHHSSAAHDHDHVYTVPSSISSIVTSTSHNRNHIPLQSAAAAVSPPRAPFLPLHHHLPLGHDSSISSLTHIDNDRMAMGTRVIPIPSMISMTTNGRAATHVSSVSVPPPTIPAAASASTSPLLSSVTNRCSYTYNDHNTKCMAMVESVGIFCSRHSKLMGIYASFLIAMHMHMYV